KPIVDRLGEAYDSPEKARLLTNNRVGFAIMLGHWGTWRGR
nr:hypothetical protein [Tanacetum cinerariifolium]